MTDEATSPKRRYLALLARAKDQAGKPEGELCRKLADAMLDRWPDLLDIDEVQPVSMFEFRWKKWHERELLVRAVKCFGSSEAEREGFTSAQVKRAVDVCNEIPVAFTDAPPSAIKDADGNLCLNWRSAPWTLSVEIDPGGDDEWWAYSTQTKMYVDGKAKISAEVESRATDHARAMPVFRPRPWPLVQIVGAPSIGSICPTIEDAIHAANRRRRGPASTWTADDARELAEWWADVDRRSGGGQ